ncbi:YncE family protein [Aliikangiella coralliicola]|uniref:YncE family protein n=1 Tax=Aliikangiella coralliicola TaxID=2592383 RepID=A0A545U7Y3_9GAMM|nr:YncE family protein [Aliikangiella coralliicola]TQV85577.1 YncE family protein [Aliikangiella coralliicola]
MKPLQSPSLLQVLIFSIMLNIAPTSTQADTLLVGNKSQATLSVIDISSNSIKRVIRTGIGPHEVAISPNQKYAAVVNYGDHSVKGNSVSLIDIDKGEVINTVTHDKLLSPHGIQWFKDNKHILVTAERNKAIVKLNPFNGKITGVAKTNAEVSHMLVISPDESFAAVSNIVSGSLSLVDLKTFKLIKEIQTGGGAEGIDISSDGSKIWVTNRDDDTVSIVEVATRKVIKTLPSKGFPIRVKISPNQKYALVSNAKMNTLTIFNASSLEKVKEMSLASDDSKVPLQFPIGILIDNKSQNAYVAHAGGDKISVIDLARLERTKLLTGGLTPDGMGFIERKVSY